VKAFLILCGLAGSAWFMIDLRGGSHAWGQSNAQVSYYGNGQPRSEVSYRDGLPHGPAEEWFPDGSAAARGCYEDGLREGQWTFWHENGSVDRDRSGLYAGGRRVGPAQDNADS